MVPARTSGPDALGQTAGAKRWRGTWTPSGGGGSPALTRTAGGVRPDGRIRPSSWTWAGRTSPIRRGSGAHAASGPA